MITTAAITAATAATQLIRYADEPTRTMPAQHRDGTPCRVAVPGPARRRRTAGSGQPSRAVTIALAVLVLVLVVGVFAVGSLT